MNAYILWAYYAHRTLQTLVSSFRVWVQQLVLRNEHWYSTHGCLLPFCTHKTTWCPHTTLLNNIGLILHNEMWHTRHVIVVHMKLRELYSVHSTSRSCLHFFLCNPYMALHNWQFFNILAVHTVFGVGSSHINPFTSCSSIVMWYLTVL